MSVGLTDEYAEDPDPLAALNLGSHVEQPVRRMYQYLERSDEVPASALRETFRERVSDAHFYLVLLPTLRDRVDGVEVDGGIAVATDALQPAEDELRRRVVQDLISPAWDYEKSGGLANPLEAMARVSVRTYERLGREEQPPVSELELQDRTGAWSGIRLPYSDWERVRDEVLPELPGFQVDGELRFRLEGGDVDDVRQEADAAGDEEEVVG